MYKSTEYGFRIGDRKKVCSGEILTFDENTFKATVRINGKGYNHTVSCQPLSPLLDANGMGATYRPKTGDHCLIAFDEIGTAYIIGYKVGFDETHGTGYRHKRPKMLGGEWRYVSDDGKSEMYFRKGGLIQIVCGHNISMIMDPDSGIMKSTFKNLQEYHPGGSRVITTTAIGSMPVTDEHITRTNGEGLFLAEAWGYTAGFYNKVFSNIKWPGGTVIEESYNGFGDTLNIIRNRIDPVGASGNNFILRVGKPSTHTDVMPSQTASGVFEFTAETATSSIGPGLKTTQFTIDKLGNYELKTYASGNPVPQTTIWGRVDGQVFIQGAVDVTMMAGLTGAVVLEALATGTLNVTADVNVNVTAAAQVNVEAPLINLGLAGSNCARFLDEVLTVHEGPQIGHIWWGSTKVFVAD